MLSAVFGCAEDAESGGMGDEDRGIDIDATRDLLSSVVETRTSRPTKALSLMLDLALPPSGHSLNDALESIRLSTQDCLYARYEHNGDQTPEFVVTTDDGMNTETQIYAGFPPSSWSYRVYQQRCTGCLYGR